MSQKILFFVIFLFSILGMIDASYLTYEKFSNQPVLCGEGFDCGTVLESPWSTIGPIPLSVFGLFFYMTVWTVVVLILMDTDFSLAGKKVAKKLQDWKVISKRPLNSFALSFVTGPEVLLLITLFGFLFSMYLVFLMGVIIKAWCAFCLFSAFTSSSLFLFTIVYWLTREKGGKASSPIFLKSLTFTVVRFLYKNFAKRIFFLFDAEVIHNSCTRSGKLLAQSKITRWFTKIFFSFQSPALHKEIDGIVFPNPVGLSAGFDYNADLVHILPEVGFGFHTVGTVTLEPYEGNKKPRLGRFPDSKALLVNKGLKSLGAKAVIKRLKAIQTFPIPLGVSIASTNRAFKNTTEQIQNVIECFTLFEKSKVGLSYYELNISCPNTFGGEPFFEPKRLERLLKAVDALKIKKPLYVKMPIDQSDKETLEMLKVIDAHNVQGVIFGNLTKDHTNPDVKPADRKEWSMKKGNLSGKPTWKRSNRLIKLTRKHYKKRFTIIGTGGIFSAQDAQKKMDLGADLVQLITGMIFEGPQVLGEIGLGLEMEN